MQQQIAGLQIAMRTRGVIEQAKGVIMREHRCDAESAFQVLVRASQESHRRVHDVALMTVAWAATGADRRSAG